MKTLVLERMPNLFYEIIQEKGWKNLFYEPGEIEPEDVDICIIRTETMFNGILMDSFPNLKQIIRAGTGYDNIDLAEAEKRGVVVCHTPDANARAAYEQTIAFILGLIKHLNLSKSAVMNQTWRKGYPSNWEISDLKVLIVGVGRVGSLVGKVLKSLGAEVKGVDPYISEKDWKTAGIESVFYAQGLGWCNLVSYHCPLTKETYNYYNMDTEKLLKMPVWIVNTARGGVVNEDALSCGLNSGIVLGAALDVFETEPWVPQEFAKQKKVILSPHVGARTTKAKIRLSRETLAVWNGFRESKKIIAQVDARFILSS